MLLHPLDYAYLDHYLQPDLVLWAVLNHVSTLTVIEEGISALSALSIVSTATLSTVLSGTLHLTSVALPGSGLPPIGVVLL